MCFAWTLDLWPEQIYQGHTIQLQRAYKETKKQFSFLVVNLVVIFTLGVGLPCLPGLLRCQKGAVRHFFPLSSQSCQPDVQTQQSQALPIKPRNQKINTSTHSTWHISCIKCTWGTNFFVCVSIVFSYLSPRTISVSFSCWRNVCKSNRRETVDQDCILGSEQPLTDAPKHALYRIIFIRMVLFNWYSEKKKDMGFALFISLLSRLNGFAWVTAGKFPGWNLLFIYVFFTLH